MYVSRAKRRSSTDWNASRQTVIQALRHEVDEANQTAKFLARNAKLEQVLDVFFHDIQDYDARQAIAIYDPLILADSLESMKRMDALVDQYLTQTELVIGKLQLYEMLKNASTAFQHAVMVKFLNQIYI